MRALLWQAEIEEIVAACPRSRQTLLFSATITEEVARLANISLHHPQQVSSQPFTMPFYASLVMSCPLPPERREEAKVDRRREEREG